MSTIVLRSVKGSPLTNNEVDQNFSNLNADKLEAASTATLTNKTINLSSNTLVATSAQLAAAVTDETGSGALVFANSPTLVTPALGTPSSGVVTNLTGTASININGTVGATTPNTGAFTTLSASGAVTLNGGTANGVAYLNGSKVLTTGNALTFDGTNLGVGTATPLTKLHIAADGDTALTVQSITGSGQSPSIRLQRGAWGSDGFNDIRLYNTSGGFFVDNIDSVGATTNMLTATTTGLGIGTSSPSSKLYVLNSSGITMTLEKAGGASLQFVNSGGNGYQIDDNSGAMRWLSAGATERMRLDSSGNLGLGVTPSAWYVYKAMQVGQSGAVWSNPSANELYLSSNYYYSSAGDKYIANGYASFYRQLNGAHTWATAPSGTAGNAISFTQAMTLNAAGNLLLGSTTAPAGFARVSLVGGESSGSGANSGIQLTYNASTFGGGAITTVNAAGGGMSFYTFTGNVGSESYTERARIDSSGNLLVGTTSAVASASNTTASATFAKAYNWFGVTDANYVQRANNTDGAVFQFLRGSSTVGVISVTASATTYSTSSDYRLKEAVQPMTGALAKVAALKPVTYKWKIDGSDGQGFIAHELAEVCPAAVTGEKDAVDAEGNPQYQGIDVSFLVATLTAAIQEQQAIITAQAAQIQQLREKVLEVEEGTSNMLVENTNNLYETITALTARVAALESN